MSNLLKKIFAFGLGLMVLAMPLSADALSFAVDLDPPRAPSVVFPRNAATGGKVILSWRIPTDPDLKGFNIYRSTTSGSQGTLLVTTDSGTNSIQDSGLTDSTTYYYTVASFDAANNEAFAPQVSSTPTTNSAALYPDDALIRFEDRPTVYKIGTNGRTIHSVSSRVFSINGYSFDDVLVIPIEWQNSFSASGSDTYRDGTLLRGDGQKTVYVLENGKKRPFASEAIFTDLGYKFGNVNVVPQANSGHADSIESYETGNPISATGIHPNGTLIRSNDDQTVYLLSGGQKKPISSASIFNSYNFDFNEVVTVSGSELNGYATAANLKFNDGSLLKGTGSTVYAVNNDSADRIPFASLVSFIGLGYDFGNVVSVSDAELTGYNIASELPI